MINIKKLNSYNKLYGLLNQIVKHELKSIYILLFIMFAFLFQLNTQAADIIESVYFNIPNDKVKIGALEDEKQKPITVTDYKEQNLFIGVPQDIFGSDWTIRIDDKDLSWAYAMRHGSDMIWLYVAENKEQWNRLLHIFIERADSLLSDFYVEQRYNPLPFKEIDFTVGYQKRELSLNIPTKEVPSFKTPSWVNIEKGEKNNYIINISENTSSMSRADTVFVTDANCLETRPLFVFQYPKNNDFIPQSLLEGDEKLKIAHAECSSEQPGGEIEFSFDGDLESIYHSVWDNSSSNYFPISMTYYFSHPEIIDYFIYIPRLDGGNGIFKKVSLYVQRKGSDNFEYLMDYDFNGKVGSHYIRFKEQLEDIVAFRFLVYSGTGGGQGLASCAEIEFYRKQSYDSGYLELFSDAVCSELRNGVTANHIKRCKEAFFRDLAFWLKKGNKPNEFRLQYYKAWSKPETMAHSNGCSPIGKLDNPTGIAAVKGEPLVLLVDCEQADSIRLAIQKLSTPQGKDGFGSIEYTLHQGINIVNPQIDGLCYIIYQVENPQEAPLAKIHIIGGHVNGYFDIEKHLYSDGSSRWKELLEKAGDQYFDVVSPYVHFTFNTSLFRRYVSDIVPLLNAYDTMVIHEQEFQGFSKYNRMLTNRVYFHSSRATYGALWSSENRIGYNEQFLHKLLNVDLFKTTECWGPAHELGHSLQIKPSFCWKGMTEVSNNILSMEIQRLWNNPSRLLEELPEGDTYHDIYERAMNNAFVYQQPYGCIEDWFDRLVPLWQLRLYMMDVCGNKDFYKDLYERCIQINKTSYGHGQWQLAFVYNCCVAANMDLRAFFKKWGWLTPTEQIVHDYGIDTLSVRQQDIDTLNIKIDMLRLPCLTDAIEYITDKNISLYQQPESFHSGTWQVDDRMYIQIKGCEGAVAYEVYNNDTLVGVSHNSSFRLRLPTTMDTVKLTVLAVLPNGKRIKCE